MTKCGKGCHACPYVKERKNIKAGQQTWNILDKLDCLSENIVYLIQCDKENCKENKYIGETSKPMHVPLSQHRGYVTRNNKDATGTSTDQDTH